LRRALAGGFSCPGHRQDLDAGTGFIDGRICPAKNSLVFIKPFAIQFAGMSVALDCCSEAAMKKIIIIVGAVLVLLGGAGAGVYFLKPDLLPEGIRPLDAAQDQHGKKKVSEAKRDPEVGADLDVFVVNLGGPSSRQFLRTTLSLGVKDEHDKEQVKEFSGPIRHAVIMYLTEQKVDDLLDPAGKNKLREALNKQINAAIGTKLVSNVYFKEFLIQ